MVTITINEPSHDIDEIHTTRRKTVHDAFLVSVLSIITGGSIPYLRNLVQPHPTLTELFLLIPTVLLTVALALGIVQFSLNTKYYHELLEKHGETSPLTKIQIILISALTAVSLVAIVGFFVALAVISFNAVIGYISLFYATVILTAIIFSISLEQL